MKLFKLNNRLVLEQFQLLSFSRWLFLSIHTFQFANYKPLKAVPLKSR